MDTLNKYIVGLFAVAALIVLLKDQGQGARNILGGFGDLNRSTFQSLVGI